MGERTLPRGGVVVTTPIGAVQVGMPPDTIKDSMNLGLTVPSVFVFPKVRTAHATLSGRQ